MHYHECEVLFPAFRLLSLAGLNQTHLLDAPLPLDDVGAHRPRLLLIHRYRKSHPLNKRSDEIMSDMIVDAENTGAELPYTIESSRYFSKVTCPADAWPPEYVMESDKHLIMFELGHRLLIDLEIRDIMVLG